MKIRVMIVDDEPYILQGLTMLIDWQGEGCEIVKTASNGQEAYEFLLDNQVDLILADIRMPIMTGLELLEKIRNEKISNAYFAILSGYNDFSYAQQAIRYACMEYILKPVSKDNLLNLVHEAIRRKNLTEQQKEKTRKLQRIYLVKNVVSLLHGKAEPESVEYLKNNLPLSSGVRYVQIIAESTEEIGEMTDDELRQLRNEMYESCCRFLRDDSIYCIKDIFDDDDSAICLLYCRQMAEMRKESGISFFEKLHREIENSLKIPITLVIGKEVEDIVKISHSYSSACVLKSFKGFRKQKNIYYYEEEVQVNQNKVVLCKQSLDNLIQAVEQNDRGAINSSVDGLYAEMEKMGLTADTVSMNTNYLLFQLIHLAVEQDESLNQEEVMLYISEHVAESGFSRGSRAHLRKFACEYAEYLIQLRKNVSRGILLEIEKEVKEHYAENLTLKELSRKYYVNSSYLGQIFRKKYGQSFKDYLTVYRINEAAQMLVRTDKKINLVAEEVGYRDTDYFISKFIEQKGCTPAKYRKNSGDIEKISGA